MHDSVDATKRPELTGLRRLAPGLLALDLLGKDANITRVAAQLEVS